MTKIPRLKLSLWQEIVYFLLVVGGPATVTCVELFQSSSTIIKVSMTSIGSLLITLLIVKKFFVKNKIDKWRNEIAQLEHDYSINVGNADYCKQQWALYNVFIYAYSSLCIILACVLFVLFAKALSDGLIQFKGAALIILLCVFVGVLFRVVCYFMYMKSEVTTDSDES